MMLSVRDCVLVGSLLGVAGGAILAQAPESRLTAGALTRVDSLVLAGDTLEALTLLESLIATDVRNAALWHRQGELSLYLARPPGTDFDWNASTIRLMRLADRSLARAIYLAPDSGRYRLTRALYYLASEAPTVRQGAAGAYRSGLEAAQRAMDSALVAELAIQLGLWHWRTYDGMSDRRRVGIDLSLVEVIERADSPRDLDHAVRTYFTDLHNSGEIDYLRSTELFLLALRFEPHNRRAWTYSYMSLLALDSWEELQSATRVRLAAEPADMWARMASGLALHRMGKYHEATEAFRQALRGFDEAERARLTRLTRILRPRDSTRLAWLSASALAASEQMFWLIADPLTLTAEHEHLLEFLSRVTYSELMFSVEEFGERGADSPRGEVYIRYGPPKQAIGTGPDPAGYYSLWWRYSDGLEFYFSLFGPTRRVNDERFAHQRSRYEKIPHSFDNLPITRLLDTIPSVVTRFRATADSTDVIVAALVPVTRLARGVDLASGTVRIGFLTFTASEVQRDTFSMQVQLTGANSEEARVRTWTARFGAPDIGYRVEAYQVESGRGARALGTVLSSASDGFGMSDILVADRLDPTVPSPERWLDFHVQPNLGTVPQGEDLALAWETYDLGADSTRSSEYSVEISLVRTDGSRLGRAIARVIGGTLGIGEGRGRDDRVAVAFDRRVPARPVTLDYLTLDLGGLDPGRYRLTITVTDAIRKASAESTRDLVIAHAPR